MSNTLKLVLYNYRHVEKCGVNYLTLFPQTAQEKNIECDPPKYYLSSWDLWIIDYFSGLKKKNLKNVSMD